MQSCVIRDAGGHAHAGRALTGFLAIAAAGAFVAGTAIAQDRSDLLDVPLESFTVAAPASAHDYVRVILDEVPPSSSFAQRRESFSVVHEFPGVDNIGFRIYEPTR